MSVSAVIVTRGDVDLTPVFDSLPYEWPIVIWDNRGICEFPENEVDKVYRCRVPVPDLAVYGRYAAIEYATSDLIYVQDDDVIVSDPQAIVDAWEPGHVVCNMPQEFRPHYPDSALVGFGACFERGLPARAFERIFRDMVNPDPTETFWSYTFRRGDAVIGPLDSEHFHRECDTVFTALTPRILVDVPKTDREFASDPDRLWKQPEHGAERARMLELARQVRDS